MKERNIYLTYFRKTKQNKTAQKNKKTKTKQTNKQKQVKISNVTLFDLTKQ